MFVGMHDHTFDDKGRVVLPSMYRSEFPDGGYVTRIGDCLALFPKDAFDDMVARLQDLVRQQKASPNAVRSFTANADTVRPDSQGRISVVSRLRESTGVARDVTIVGAGDRIELWTPQRWIEVQADSDEDLVTTFASGV